MPEPVSAHQAADRPPAKPTKPPANPADAVRGATGLPEIGVVDLRQGGPLELARGRLPGALDLVASARTAYGAVVLGGGDWLSRRWLARNTSPYASEIRAIADLVGQPGMVFLNLSYEWSCTSGAGPDPEGQGEGEGEGEDRGQGQGESQDPNEAAGASQRLLRTLDWPLAGLGRNLVAARQAGPAGDWLNLTWPGFVGCATGVAPGRFAAALNQPPMRRHGLGAIGNWAVGRLRGWFRRGLPATHLLRQAMETCADYAAARQMLMEVPIAAPAFFILAGAGAGEACVIERLETAAFVRDGAGAAANHWQTANVGGGARGRDSHARLDAMLALVGDRSPGLDWLRAPILNPDTRLALTANAATGRLVVRAYETDGPVSRATRIQA